MDEPTVRAGLARLQAAEFLHEILLFPETEYTFKHALTHEVAYGTLLRDRQRTLHARLVDAIEQVYRGGSTNRWSGWLSTPSWARYGERR